MATFTNDFKKDFFNLEDVKKRVKLETLHDIEMQKKVY